MKNAQTTKVIVCTFLVIIIIGCHQNKPYHSDILSFTVDIKTKETTIFEDFFDLDKMSIIQFADERPLFLSDNLQIEFAENYIFVFDKGNVQLYRFDRTGNLINKIGRSGKGPAEYANAGFFSINQNQSTLNILCDNGSAIMVYDFEGKLIKKFATPLIATSFDCINSNLYYYYTGYHNSPNSHRLHKADSVKILESYLPIQTQALDMIEMNFTHRGEIGYFRETFFPSVYKYDSDGIQEIFKMAFGDCEITQKRLEKVQDPLDFFQEIKKNGFCSTTSVVAGKDQIYVVAIHQKQLAHHFFHFHINLADSAYTRVIDYPRGQNEKNVLRHLKPVYLDSEDNMYFVANPINLEGFLKTEPALQKGLKSNENLNPFVLLLPLNSN